jgi:hypothetical protein
MNSHFIGEKTIGWIETARIMGQHSPMLKKALRDENFMLRRVVKGDFA